MSGRVSALSHGTSSDSVQSAHLHAGLSTLFCCASCLRLHIQVSDFRISDHSECGRISSHINCFTINFDDCVRLLMSLVNNCWLKLFLDLCTAIFQFRIPEPSDVVSVLQSSCLCSGQEYIVHNLHCFWKIRMLSVPSVTG